MSVEIARIAVHQADLPAAHNVQKTKILTNHEVKA
jgi:hypothetical protein